MMTQTLIGSVGTEPLHWRGDRADMAAFSVGFTGLLGADAPPSPSRDGRRSRRSSRPSASSRIRYRTFTDGLPPSVPGFSGDPSNGATLFTTARARPVDDDLRDLSHDADRRRRLPGVAEPARRRRRRSTSRSSATCTRRSASTSRRRPTIAASASATTAASTRSSRFLKQSRFTFPAGAAGDAQRRDLEAFVMCFPTDTHPGGRHAAHRRRRQQEQRRRRSPCSAT